MSERTDTLLARMTLEEKAALAAGSGMWHTTPIERLDIPRMKLSDGPIGVRGAGTEALSGRAESVTVIPF